MGLFERLKKLEGIVRNKQGLDNSIIVFAVGPNEDWIYEEQRYKDERIPFEEYSCPESLKQYTRIARDLEDLRTLSMKHRFSLVVLPSEMKINEIWIEE